MGVGLAACIVKDDRQDRFDDGAGAASSAVAQSGAGGMTSVNTSVQTSSTSVGVTNSSSTSASTGSGDSCPDTGDEPNDTEADATDLGILPDECDSSGSTVYGVLSGNDVDWFMYQGTDTFSTCQVDPGRSVSANGQVRICKFLECDGLATPSCPTGTTSESSPEGRPGCCSLNAFNLGVNCSGISDDAKVYIRLDKPSSFPCIDYGLEFHY